jgi:hypothetical protein
LASWAKVVIVYLLSDFLGLWQAIQFCTKIGATSFKKLTGAGSSWACEEGTSIKLSRNVASLGRTRFIAGTLQQE